MKTKTQAEPTRWTYIRVRKPTRTRLQILKAELDFEVYDDVVNMLLNNFKKTKNEKTKNNSSQGK